MAMVSLLPPGEIELFGICASLPLFIAGIGTGGVGGGDVKLTAAVGVVTGLRNTIMGITTGLGIMLLYHAVVIVVNRIYRQKEPNRSYPFVPFLWIGMLICGF